MSELVSYAMDFASFFIQNTKYLGEIRSILLFGSSARGDANKKSDVDIFIDVLDEKKLSAEAEKIRDDFFKSIKYSKYWKLLGITNEVNIIVGKIDKWKLRDSISGEAIVLYGKYSPEIKEGKNSVIFSWENVKPNSKRVLFNKKIFGYIHRGKFYQGLIGLYGGEKLSKGTIIFDAKYIQEVLKIFRQFKVSVKINKVMRYG